MNYDFSVFPNVTISGADLTRLTDEELSVLSVHARYCQAMTDADLETMRQIVSEDVMFTHMSGRKQSREAYFSDVANGSLRYFTVGIENPAIRVDGGKAAVTCVSVLKADAYGASGTFRMKGMRRYEKRNGAWIAVNG